MNCNIFSDYIIDFIDNKLDENTKNDITKHLEECSKCKLEYEQTKEIFSDIEKIPLKNPKADLKISFDKVLEEEKYKQKSFKTKSSKLKNYRVILQIAATIILIVSAYWFGYNTKIESVKDNQMAEMQNDISEMKQQMYAINMLKNESASSRIQAVNYIEEMKSPKNDLIKALINTLETDPSSNVRLAAVYSLSRFKTNKVVKEAFINTLNKQKDPMVQIVIINLLIEIEEVKAVDELKILLKNKDLHEEVKKQAELGVKVLI